MLSFIKTFIASRLCRNYKVTFYYFQIRYLKRASFFNVLFGGQSKLTKPVLFWKLWICKYPISIHQKKSKTTQSISRQSRGQKHKTLATNFTFHVFSSIMPSKSSKWNPKAKKDSYNNYLTNTYLAPQIHIGTTYVRMIKT